MTKHSYFPYTSTNSSTHHNTNRKHNIHPTPYTDIQHTSTLQGLKNTIFNNGRYTTNIPTDPQIILTSDIKIDKYHIHTSIVSMHLATRCNNKILRTPPPQLAALKRYFSASLVAPLPNSKQINYPSSSQMYIKSTPNHIHHHYVPSVTLTHTTHIISSTAPIYAPHCHRWICGHAPPE